MTNPYTQTATAADFAASSSADAAEASAYRKVTWRLLPFLMLCYVVAYLDRVNVGFASPYLIGWLKDLTQSTNIGMYVLATVLVGGALAVLSVPARLVNR